MSLSLHALIEYYLFLFVHAVSLLFGNVLITIMFGSVSIGSSELFQTSLPMLTDPNKIACW